MRLNCRKWLVALGATVSTTFVVAAFAAAPEKPVPQANVPQANVPQAQLPQPAMPKVPVPPPPEFKSSSWVLMDFDTGRILASKKPDLRVAPASITKVMTEYVIDSSIKAGKVHMDDQVFVSVNAWKKGGAATDSSTSFLKVHAKYPLKTLMYGMIVQSGNDAAIALSEHVAGSEQGFVSLMNAYAKRLGMKNTHYSNVTGYPVDNHYSTAYDTAILTRSLISKFPENYKISSVKEVTINGIKQYNRNSLLWRDPSVDGVKTGHTKAAGYCLDASAIRNGHRLIAVVMGTPSADARVDDAQALLNYGFRFFKRHQLYKAGETVATPRLWKGQSDTLPVGVTKDFSVVVKQGNYKKLQASIQLPNALVAPFKKGQKVGTITVSLDGKVLASAPVVALEDAPKAGFMSRLWDSVMMWFHDDGPTTAKPKAAAGDSTGGDAS